MRKTAMNFMRAAAVAAALTLGGGLGGAALAARQTEEASASWSSPAIERVGQMLCGTWRTNAAVPVAGSTTGETVNLVLSIGPIQIEGIPDAMYCEAARADALWAPYRQAIFQLYEYRGKIRLRTFEFHNANVEKAAFIGAWAVPEAFPTLTKDHFIATLDIEGAESGGVFSGRTPAPYPTAVGGAVEMTSEIEISATRLVTADRGYDAQGAIVWGQEAGGRYEYSRVDPEVTVRRDGDGLVVMEYRSGTGRVGEPGDTIAVHYSGWFSRNAALFDSSRNRGVPMSYILPGQMIAGWLRGTEGLRPGALRRIYIPYTLGYGEAGQPPRMPARANLVFEVECVNLAAVPAPARGGVEAPRQQGDPRVDSATNPG